MIAISLAWLVMTGVGTHASSEFVGGVNYVQNADANRSTSSARSYRFLVVPMVFRDTTDRPPYSRTQLSQVFFHPTKGVDAFIRTSSSNRANLQGTVISDFVVMPRDREAYIGRDVARDKVSPGFFSAQYLIDDLGPILETRYDLSKFSGVIMLPNRGDANNYGSTQEPMYRRKGDTQARKLMTFYSSAPAQTGMIHEMGHVLNIGHVRVVDSRPLNPSTAMAFPGKQDPDVFGKTSDHLMWHKELLGWVDPSDIVIQKSGTATHRIYARSQPNGKLRMVKIPLGDQGEAVTLEAMLPIGNDADAGIPEFGLVITKVNESKVKLANLGIFPEQYLPETQVSSSRGVAFQPGMSWRDERGLVEAQVLVVTRAYVDVKVTIR